MIKQCIPVRFVNHPSPNAQGPVGRLEILYPQWDATDKLAHAIAHDGRTDVIDAALRWLDAQVYTSETWIMPREIRLEEVGRGEATIHIGYGRYSITRPLRV